MVDVGRHTYAVAHVVLIGMSAVAHVVLLVYGYELFTTADVDGWP